MYVAEDIIFFRSSKDPTNQESNQRYLRVRNKHIPASMKLPSVIALLLAVSPTFDSVHATDTGDFPDVFKMAARDIPDKQLGDLVIEPSMKFPNTKSSVPQVPGDLSDDPNDPNFVFEGYLMEPDTNTAVEDLRIKRKHMQDYFFGLGDQEIKELEARLETRRINKARKAARMRGVPFDERKQLTIAITKGNQVWSLRAVNSNVTATRTAQNSGEANPFDAWNGVESHTTELSRVAQDRGIGLNLVSGHNGNDMTLYPWTTQGCISSSNSSSDCFCSGTKISARLVLTAGHCLSEGDGTWFPPAKYWLPGADGVDKAANGNDDTPNGVKDYAVKFVDTAWFYGEIATRDWGLFVLSPDSSNCDLGWLGYKIQPSAGVVNVYGYPAQGTCEASPFVSGLCYDSLYGESDQVKDQSIILMEYDIDTQGGMSGSGVYEYIQNPDQRHVVGVHVRGLGLSGFAIKVNEDIFDSIEAIRTE